MSKKSTCDIMTSLPEEMLTEIVMHAASSSVDDFINVRLSCKAFLAASNYDQVFENVSMEKVGFVPWRRSERVFEKRCRAAKNAEALYRKGMVDFFSRKKPDSGLHCLKKATEKGHVEAMYAYGIILICLGGELREQGLRVLSSLDLEKSNKGVSKMIVNCRSKTKKILRCMWVYETLAAPEGIDCDCDRDRDSSSLEDEAWEASNNVGHCCDTFFWEREANLFSNLLRKY
ncbi:P-loop containing nucleoside triphosphate hydrolases superfamily protein isoform 1 [Hibiscus syriacus]|uniref:P-loop containing nucleoside triphosphate hydrolases superfamily protein isoform 1 n=1 Tax=Hibiscus syriacus TaxID=106335 RepID=A0A6A3AS80_HIBSY|nr:P-loop containing nucleoside triphosphate hydrolases superfamily protein isoform 1 [Hibiscus syriacus]